jgi:nucleotide-binding universal stress UspA family protein
MEVGDDERPKEEAVMKVASVLVPLDGSAAVAEAAVPKAVEFIRQNPGATVRLLRAAEATTLPGVDPTDAQVAVVREAEEYVERIAARLRDEGVGPVKTSVWYGAAAPAIVEAAGVTGADLIVMSTHGRSGIGRLMLGSVAESVLRAPTRRSSSCAPATRRSSAHPDTRLADPASRPMPDAREGTEGALAHGRDEVPRRALRQSHGEPCPAPAAAALHEAAPCSGTTAFRRCRRRRRS